MVFVGNLLSRVLTLLNNLCSFRDITASYGDIKSRKKNSCTLVSQDTCNTIWFILVVCHVKVVSVLLRRNLNFNLNSCVCSYTGDAVVPRKGKTHGLKIFHRFHFASALKRMSVIAGHNPMGSVETHYLATIKGAPETIRAMVLESRCYSEL